MVMRFLFVLGMDSLPEEIPTESQKEEAAGVMLWRGLLVMTQEKD
jgi:hypothetical protein